MAKNRDIVITCPRCGMEYLPAEIFYPNIFFGRPSNIDRDYNHKLIDYCGTSLNNEESYTCNNCKTPFRVYASVNFRSVIDSSKDISKPYVTKLRKETLFMDEG